MGERLFHLLGAIDSIAVTLGIVVGLTSWFIGENSILGDGLRWSANAANQDR
jgi:hypothetical protein